MTNNDIALPPTEDRAAAATQSSPQAVLSKADIPSAGDLVIIEHPYVYDRHAAAMVVKTGKTMWTVRYRDRFSESGWTLDRRRKVVNWLPAPAEMAAADIHEFLQRAGDDLMAAEKQLRLEYRASIKAFAQGTSGFAQDPQGLDPKGAGPTPSGVAP